MAQSVNPKRGAYRLRIVLILMILLIVIVALSAVSSSVVMRGGAASMVTVTNAEAATPVRVLAAANEPPHIKHDIAGRENCLICHNPEGKIKPAPKDHMGRKVDVCLSCHKQK